MQSLPRRAFRITKATCTESIVLSERSELYQSFASLSGQLLETYILLDDHDESTETLHSENS